MQTLGQYARDMEVAVAGNQGTLVPSSVRSLANGTLQKNQWTVTVTGATDVPYVLSVNLPSGESVEVTYDEGAAGTLTTKRDGLIAAINADLTLKMWVVASAKDADEFYVEARHAGHEISVTESDAQLTVTESVESTAGAVLPFGRAVVYLGNEGKTGTLPSGNSDVFAGIALRHHSVVNDGTEGYPVGETMAVLEQGDAWVEVDQDVVAGDPVYFRHTAGGSEKYGVFRKDADTADATQVTGAKFLTKASAGGLALVVLK